MITAEIADDRIRIQSEYRDRDRVKQVPGARWDKDNKVWTTPISWAACIALRGVFGQDIQIGPELAQWSWDEYNNRVKPADDLRTALEAASLMADEPDLYPFQRSGVKFLETAKQALIADEMGSGKTIQIIRALERQGVVPALIVCPNSMKFTWAKEIEKWSSLRPSVVDGTALKRRKAIEAIEEDQADVLIINWESLRLHTRLEAFGSNALTAKEKELKELNGIEWSAVVADEAHRAKNAKAKQTRALWAVSRGADVRIAATGTPIANHPGELWSVMNFVSPLDFPRKTSFIDRYCQLSWNAFGGMDITGVRPDRQDEFNSVIDSRMIRRIKDVVLPYLPSKVYATREVTMSAKQRRAYNQMADNMLAEIEGGLIAAVNPLSQMTRLSQFSCAYAELDEDGGVTLSAPSNKIDALMDIMEELGDEQVVVFAESRQLIGLAEAAFEKAGISFGLVTGNTPPAMRTTNIEEFQNGNLQGMLVTLGAGGEGITLTAARVAVFLQRSWSLVKNKQAEDRLHRPGAEIHDSIEIIDVVTKDTIEEYRAVKLETKEDRLQEVVRDDVLRSMLKYRGEKR